jgi:hypothetical protein
MLVTWIGRDAGPSGKVITKEKGNLALNKERRLWGVSVPRSRLAPCCTQPMEGAACIVVIAANWGQTVAAPKSPQTMVN